MGSPELSVVCVHYRTPALLAGAVAALRADATATGLPVEILVVDNGSAAADRELLGRLGDRVIDPGGNLGYGAAANLGFAASRAERLVVMNPDVTVLPGCLAALLDALRTGAAACGPRSYWDPGTRMLLPPTGEVGRLAELRRWRALASPAGAEAERTRWRARARRYWGAARPIPFTGLPGAMLGFTRQALAASGGFDPGYRLYFEDADLLERIAAGGGDVRLVPAARAIHQGGASTDLEPRAGEWFAASEHRFRSRHLGSWFTWLLGRLPAPGPLAHGLPRIQARAGRATSLPLPSGGPDPLWIEISPLAVGCPSAGEALASPRPAAYELPDDVWSRAPAPVLYLRAVDADGIERAGWEIARG